MEKKVGNMSPAPNRDAIRPTMASKPWLASARGLPWLMMRIPVESAAVLMIVARSKRGNDGSPPAAMPSAGVRNRPGRYPVQNPRGPARRRAAGPSRPAASRRPLRPQR